MKEAEGYIDCPPFANRQSEDPLRIAKNKKRGAGWTSQAFAGQEKVTGYGSRVMGSDSRTTLSDDAGEKAACSLFLCVRVVAEERTRNDERRR